MLLVPSIRAAASHEYSLEGRSSEKFPSGLEWDPAWDALWWSACGGCAWVGSVNSFPQTRGAIDHCCFGCQWKLSLESHGFHGLRGLIGIQVKF